MRCERLLPPFFPYTHTHAHTHTHTHTSFRPRAAHTTCRQGSARAMSSRKRALREAPNQYPAGAVAWSNENFIAVGQERSVCVLVRPTGEFPSVLSLSLLLPHLPLNRTLRKSAAQSDMYASWMTPSRRTGMRPMRTMTSSRAARALSNFASDDATRACSLPARRRDGRPDPRFHREISLGLHSG